MHVKRKSINKKLVYTDNKNNGWEEAIQAAKLVLLRTQVRGRELEGVIRIFTEKMKSGEPFPGLKALGVGVQELDRKRRANG